MHSDGGGKPITGLLSPSAYQNGWSLRSVDTRFSAVKKVSRDLSQGHVETIPEVPRQSVKLSRLSDNDQLTLFYGRVRTLKGRSSAPARLQSDLTCPE